MKDMKGNKRLLVLVPHFASVKEEQRLPLNSYLGFFSCPSCLPVKNFPAPLSNWSGKRIIIGMAKHIALLLAAFLSCGMPALDASNNTPFVPDNTDAPVLNQDYIVPKVLVDPRTKITYYLESDGRHISAISPEGKLLWHVDPFVDAELKPYRCKRPIILYFDFADPAWWKIHSWLGPADDFIGINFSSSQFGALNKRTAKFTCFGQD